MRKFTICREKKGSLYQVWSPSVGHIVIQAKSEEEGITELKKRIREYLKKFPKDLEKFEEEIKSPRIRKLKK